MFKDIEFTYEEGSNDTNDITVIALSTCGFCWKGINFLKNNSIKFRYVYIDKVPFEVKARVKTKLLEKYDKKVSFPYVILNEKEVFTGFREEFWKEKFQIDQRDNENDE